MSGLSSKTGLNSGSWESSTLTVANTSTKTNGLFRALLPGSAA